MIERPPAGRGRARALGLPLGTTFNPGRFNAITDVVGVRVGHRTIWRGSKPGETVARTGVTAVWPHGGNPFRERVYAAVSAFNGYGIMTGSQAIDEWGLLAAPILMTDTANVGAVYAAAVRYLSRYDDPGDVSMPVVAECEDGFLNDNRAGALSQEDVFAALDGAQTETVAEGCVGAGTGTQMFDFKGGIGTASRVVDIAGAQFTVGVLLNTNYGTRNQLTIAGRPVGRRIPGWRPERHTEGSCVGIVATDLPLHPRQLKRVARRVDAGLIRTGSVGNDGSGEIFLAFSTANRIPRAITGPTVPIDVMVEGQSGPRGSPFDTVFDAVAEATEEAALNALCQASTVEGRDGHVLHGIPIDEMLAALA